jgi:hypothetical protein
MLQMSPWSKNLTQKPPRTGKTALALYTGGSRGRSDLQQTRFEMIVERKLRRRQLTEDGNVEINGRDLCEKTPPVGHGRLFGQRGLAAGWM